MQVTGNLNNNQYQALNAQQKPITIPVEPPKEPTYSNKEIYDASNGNIIRSDGELTLTPQGEHNIANNQADKEAEAQRVDQEKKDSQRTTATGYLAHKSKQSQIEIYLSVATDSKVELSDNGTAGVIASLRDVQKQNNTVEAYATYKENQASSPIGTFSGEIAS